MRIKAEIIDTNEIVYILQFIINSINFVNAICVRENGEIFCTAVLNLRIVDKGYIGYK